MREAAFLYGYPRQPAPQTDPPLWIGLAWYFADGTSMGSGDMLPQGIALFSQLRHRSDGPDGAGR